jgi:hypothetical protein
MRLNPLDGVYYCYIRPNMVNNSLLSEHIQTIDYFFYLECRERTPATVVITWRRDESRQIKNMSDNEYNLIFWSWLLLNIFL